MDQLPFLLVVFQLPQLALLAIILAMSVLEDLQASVFLVKKVFI
jgi:hypothetical protein